MQRSSDRGAQPILRASSPLRAAGYDHMNPVEKTHVSNVYSSYRYCIPTGLCGVMVSAFACKPEFLGFESRWKQKFYRCSTNQPFQNHNKLLKIRIFICYEDVSWFGFALNTYVI